MDSYENDIRAAEHRHPVDYFEPLESSDEPVENSIPRIKEGLARTLVWGAQGEHLDDKGLRLVVMLRALRGDLFGEQTFEQLAREKGCTKQRVQVLDREFRKTFLGE